MLVNSPVEIKTKDFYEFVLLGGIIVSEELDLDLGDSLSESDDKVILTIAPRPSITDNDKYVGGVVRTISKTAILYVNHHKIEKVSMTPEQQEEWHKAVNKAMNPIA